MAESSSFCKRLSEIVGDDLPSFLSFRSAGDGMWVVTGCLRWLSMTCVLWPMVWTTYPDQGEHRSGRGFESAVCPPRGTRVESWHATCRMGECYVGLPRGHLGGSLQHYNHCSRPSITTCRRFTSHWRTLSCKRWPRFRRIRAWTFGGKSGWSPRSCDDHLKI